MYGLCLYCKKISLVCLTCEEPQVLFEGDDDFNCKHCGESYNRYEILDEDVFNNKYEEMLPTVPAGCTNCMGPETVCKFGEVYLCTQCLLHYNDLESCDWCSHQSDSVPELSYIGGCEFCEGDQRHLDD